MWRILLTLLVGLPVVAIVLHHDTISVLLIIFWMMAVLPYTILKAVDFYRDENERSRHALFVKNLLRLPIGLFGALSFLMGAGVTGWIGYNLFVRRMPELKAANNLPGALLRGGLIGLVLMVFGGYLIWLATRKFGAPEPDIGELYPIDLSAHPNLAPRGQRPRSDLPRGERGNERDGLD